MILLTFWPADPSAAFAQLAGLAENLTTAPSITRFHTVCLTFASNFSVAEKPQHSRYGRSQDRPFPYDACACCRLAVWFAPSSLKRGKMKTPAILPLNFSSTPLDSPMQKTG